MQGTGIGDRTVAVLGGTGEQGLGLGRRLALAGARGCSAQRAAEAATGFPGRVVGLDNAGAAVAGDVVVVAVPWQGHRDLLASLAGPVAGPLAG